MTILISFILLVVISHIIFTNYFIKEPEQRCVQTLEGIKCYEDGDSQNLNYPIDFHLNLSGDKNASELD